MKKYLSLLLIFIAINLNAQWIQMSSGFGNNKVVLSLTSVGTDIFAGIYTFPTGPSGVYRSTNCGETWTQTSLKKIYVGALGSQDETLFAGLFYPSSGDGGLYVSTNRGANWVQSVLNKGVTSLDVSGSKVCAGTINSGMYISTDNGLSWPKNVLTDMYIQSIAVSGNNIFAGTSDSGIYYSTNSGNNWVHSSIDNQTVFSLAAIPDRVFAGTFRFGVCVSTNNGAYWQRTSLDNQWVYAISALGNYVVAATHGNGIYLSVNYGANWFNISEGLGYTAIKVLLIAGNYLYAGTDGYSVWRRPLSEILETINHGNEIPSSFSLSQNYPNPFNPVTTVGYSVPYASLVRISVFDASGREVGILVNKTMQSGKYSVNWDASSFPSGVYFCKLTAGNFTDTKKMMLIK
jgi:hypothetical protein